MTKPDEYIIDPPVTPFSTADEIKKWIDELKEMEQTPNVIAAINQAHGWLEEHPDAD